MAHNYRRKVPAVGMGTGEDDNEACNIDETWATRTRERKTFFKCRFIMMYRRAGRLNRRRLERQRSSDTVQLERRALYVSHTSSEQCTDTCLSTAVCPLIIRGTTNRTKCFLWILMPLITWLVRLVLHSPTARGQSLHHTAVCLSVPPNLHANQERIIRRRAETPLWGRWTSGAALAAGNCIREHVHVGTLYVTDSHN